MLVHIQDKEKILVAFNHLWNELDKTWDGDERPDDWDTTCEAMETIREELGIEYKEYGTLL